VSDLEGSVSFGGADGEYVGFDEREVGS